MYSNILRCRKVRDWISKYRSMEAAGFITDKNRHYAKELKEQAACDYLSGECSYREIAEKYKLHSSAQLRQWVMVYTVHGELKTTRTGGYTKMNLRYADCFLCNREQQQYFSCI